MRIIKKILVFPLIILVAIIVSIMKLLIYVEAHLAGILAIIFGICVLLAVINHMWLQLGVFVIIIGAGVLMIVLSFQLFLWTEDFLNFLKRV